MRPPGRTVSYRTHSDAGVKPGIEKSAGIGDLERMLEDSASPRRVCLKLAEILRVHHNEVALLRLEHGSLRFIVPAPLRLAGVIPLTSTAVAARTAATRTPLLSNAFARRSGLHRGGSATTGRGSRSSCPHALHAGRRSPGRKRHLGARVGRPGYYRRRACAAEKATAEG